MDSLKDNFKPLIDQFKLSTQHILVCRKDGIPLMTHNIDNSDGRGALVAGAWQAIEAVLESNQNREMRLSFDSTESGVYILPLDEELNFYSVMIFENIMNPGQLKNQFRLFRDELRTHLTVLAEDINDNKVLFENITDEEIDTLFSF